MSPRLGLAWIGSGVLLAAGCSLLGGLEDLKGGGTGGADASIGGSSGDAGGQAGGSGDSGAGDSGTNCPPGKKACGSDCVSIDDPATGCAKPGCDQCGLGHASAICVGGDCVVAQCAAGFEDCNGEPGDGCEADLKNDTASCGGCGKSCALPNAKVSCSSGTCQFDGCETGYEDCNKDPSDGCETNTLADPTHCGACGTLCPVPVGKSATCEQGVCGISNCAAPLADCDQDPGGNCETDVSSSVSHCGFCGNACSFANGDAACVAGACTLAGCKPGYGNCDDNPANGCEMATSGSVQNCGTCGKVCAGGAQATPDCVSGACQLKCNAGWANCDNNAANGCEVNLTGDVANCGTCGKACSAANGIPSCGGGGCSIACNAGWASCDGNVANGCETSLSTDTNCKVCGAVVSASGSAGNNYPYELRKVTGSGNKLTFQSCYYDYDYGDTCTTPAITLATGTASGTAGNNYPYVLRKVTASGNKLTFQSCYYDYDYGDTCTPQVITLSGLTASGTAGSNYPYVLRKVTASGNKLTFQSCYYDYDYGDTCTPQVITLSCGP